MKSVLEPTKTEAWVTFVNNDEDVNQALVLLVSLRKVATSRELLVLVSPSVALEKRLLLNGVANSVSEVILNDKMCFLNDINTQVMMHCFSLTFFSKLVFIPANTVVMSNCDKIFELKNGFCCISPSIENSSFILLLSPSLQIHYDICNAIRKEPIKDFDGCMNGVLVNILRRNYNLQTAFKELPELQFFINPKTISESKNSQEKGFLFFSSAPIDFIKNEKSITDALKDIKDIVNKENISNAYFMAPRNEEIAVIGIALRLPGANSLNEFWKILINKEDKITTVPENRWLSSQSCFCSDESRKAKAGFLSVEVDEFDNQFFEMSPLQVMYTDPQHRLLLELMWESLEDAGINPESLRGTDTSIFVGEWTTDYLDLMKEAHFGLEQRFRTYNGNSFGNAAGKMAHFLNVNGPNLGIEAGCTASLIAVGHAIESLRNKTSKLAIAAGCNLLLHPFAYSDFENLVSPVGESIPFDKNANGFVRADGCAVLILKRLSDALQDNNRIYGVIRGYGMSQEGESVSMGTPTVQCEARAMQLALNDASVHPEQVQYVEAHGTGTPVGDKMEIEGIKQVYSRKRNNVLFIGSAKSNIGHTESCSGIVGVIKVLLSMQKEIIPPLKDLKQINPNLELCDIPATIPVESKEWKKSINPRLAGVSSFGLTGADAHVILEEAPTLPIKIHFPIKLSKYLITLSTKSEDSLNRLLSSYANFLQLNTSEDIFTIAYSSNVRRAHFNCRATVKGNDVQEVSRNLAGGLIKKQTQISEDKKVCFLYTGQGPEIFGVGKQLYEHFAMFRKTFEECNKITKQFLTFDLKDFLFSKNVINFKENQLHTHLLFAVQYSLSMLWQSFGIVPDTILGHSAGEFAAAVVAGILSVNDALHIIEHRRKTLLKVQEGGMLAVLCEETKVQDLLEKFQNDLPFNEDFWIDIAAVNSKSQVVVSGPTKALQAFTKFCSKVATCVTLNVQKANHSRVFNPVLKEFGEKIKDIVHSYPKISFVSSVSNNFEPPSSPNYWVQHLRTKVNFYEATRAVCDVNKSMVFLEIGPHPVLCNLVSKLSKDLIVIPSMIAKCDEYETIIDAVEQLYLNGFTIDWKNFYFGQPIPHNISLPLYPFQRKKFWFPQTDFKERKEFSSETHNTNPLIKQRSVFPNEDKEFVTSTISFSKDIPFVIDHKLGNDIVFPGACYVEMAISASQDSEKMFPISISNIKLLNMLTAESNEETKFVLKLSRAAETVQVYSSQNSEHDWKTNFESASARVVQTTPYKFNMTNLFKDFANFLVLEPYPAMQKVGYNFGPLFQSLHSVKISHTSLLAEVCKIGALLDAGFIGYCCHPILVDAMMQAVIICEHSVFKSLYIPVAIKEFIVFKQTSIFEKHYVLVELENGGNTSFLLDKDGEAVAMMHDLTTVETSLEAINLLVERKHSDSEINKFELIWKVTGQERVELLENIPSDCLQAIQTLQNIIPDDKIFKESNELKELDKYIGQELYKILKRGMSDLSIFTLEDVLKALKIKEEFKLVTKRFLEILVEDSYVSKLGEFEYGWNESIKIHKKTSNFVTIPIEYQLSKVFLTNLQQILTAGSSKALEIFFPDDDKSESQFSAEVCYRNLCTTNQSNKMLSEVLHSLLSQYLCKKANKKTLHLLEIGAGTGNTAIYVAETCHKNGIAFSYTYTDISLHFFDSAKTRLNKFSSNMIFKELNIEIDPKAQGFVPHYYDIVIAGNSLHATSNLAKTVKHVRDLVKQFGFLFIAETYKPIRYVDISWGLLPGYWEFTDKNLRPEHCAISQQQWMNILSKNGCQNMHCFACCNETVGLTVNQLVSNELLTLDRTDCDFPPKAWIIFGLKNNLVFNAVNYLRNADREVVYVEKGCEYEQPNDLQFKIRPDIKTDMDKVFQHCLAKFTDTQLEGILFFWSLEGKCISTSTTNTVSYLHLLQNLTKLIHQPKCVCVFKGCVFIGDQDPFQSNFCNLTMWGMTKTYKSENPLNQCKLVDVDPGCKHVEEALDQILFEMFYHDEEPFAAYRNGIRHVQRIVDINTMALNIYKDLEFPLKQGFALRFPETNSIGDLEFQKISNPTADSSDFSIEVNIQVAGLNFKDIFTIVKPTEAFKNMSTFGGDFSGIVCTVGPGVQKVKVGDAVLGLMYNSPLLSSKVSLLESDVILLPKKMNFCDGATLPVAFTTAIYGLIYVAKLQKDEIVLIHTASGGVGLAAIQVALSVGAQVIATAGSNRKRAYLHNIGVVHVFNSRTQAFCQQVLEATKQKGADVVLNSITGPGMKEASLNCLKKGGSRFIEMSKLNTWTKDEVQALRPDVQYDIIDMTLDYKGICTTPLRYLEEHMHQFQPLPYVRFEASEVRDAIKHLESAKHIGKVLCVFPQADKNSSKLCKRKLFNEFGTYIITGGLTGIGLTTAKWLCNNGAKYLILVGRRLPSSEANKTINKLKNLGKQIHVMQADVGEFEDCKHVFEFAEQTSNIYPPIRGVIHSAGSLADAVISNQNKDMMYTTMHPKVNGAWNLHLLTKDINLEFFVMYSTMVAIFGSPGQSNHSAANSFLDALAHYRYNSGLPALSINWGQWGEVGVAKDMKLTWTQPFSAAKGFAILKEAMISKRVQVVAGMVSIPSINEWFPWLKTITSQIESNLAVKTEKQNVPGVLNSLKFWSKVTETVEQGNLKEFILQIVKHILARILHVENAADLGNHDKLVALGLDSLMRLELRNQIRQLFADKAVISAADLEACETPLCLANKIEEIVSAQSKGKSGSSLLSADKISAARNRASLIISDCNIFNSAASHAKPHANKLQTFLITGATGFLGVYILSQLVANDTVQKVYCLVRQKHSGEEVRTTLLNHLLPIDLPDLLLEKIEVLQGDLSEQYFGLSPKVYEILAENTDAIFHCGAYVNHTAQYPSSKLEYNQLRSVNVLGTQRVIEFAIARKTKHIFFTSTVLVTQVGRDLATAAEFYDEWLPLVTKDDLLNTPHFGYAISKYICEQLLKNANRCEIPVKIFRLPSIGGNSHGKTKKIITSHVNMFYMHCMSTGCFPNNVIPLQTFPVNICVDVMLKLCLNCLVPNGVYSILNPHFVKKEDIVELCKEFSGKLRLFTELRRLQKAETNSDNIDEALKLVLGHKYLKLTERVTKKLKEIDVNDIEFSNLLRNNYDTTTKFVDFDIFVIELQKFGEASFLYAFQDIYTGNDKIFDFSVKSLEHFFKSWASNKDKKVVKFIKNYINIFEHPIETLKRDINSILLNSSFLFKTSTDKI